MSKRLARHVGAGVVLAPIVALLLWSSWVTYAFPPRSSVSHHVVRAASMAWTLPPLKKMTADSLWAGVAIAWMVTGLSYRFGNPRMLKRGFVRGSEFVDPQDLASVTRRSEWSVGRSRKGSVTLAGIPIPHAVERLHFLIGGTTQSGKSVTITEMLAGALERGDRVVVADPNGGHLARFARKGDVVLNHFDARSVGWSIFNEISKPYDVERNARSVIPDARSAQDFEWHGYARLLFSETAQRLIELRETTTTQLLHWLTVAKIEELEGLLQETPAVGLFDKGGNKALSSTRFILTKHLNPHKRLKAGDFSLRRWLEGE